MFIGHLPAGYLLTRAVIMSVEANVVWLVCVHYSQLGELGTKSSAFVVAIEPAP